MMPKGVEHSEDGSASHNPRDVSLPMMPKGVEHPTLCAYFGCTST